MTPGAASTRIRRWLPGIAVAAAIVVASVVRVPGEPSPGLGLGNLSTLFHLVGYAALALAVTPAFSIDRTRTESARSGVAAVPTAMLFGLAAATLFGVAVELVQAPIPWRSFAVADAAINAVGAVLGVGVLGSWRRWRR